MLLDSASFDCPWCGESNPLPLDPEESGQVIVQDCMVCCAPIEIQLPADPGEAPRILREGE
jgi:hypothetical protein